MKRTPLHDVHENSKAKMVEFAGWRMPVQYGPILDEVRCVRERVGLFDLSHMGRLSVTGPDRVSYIDRIATNYCAKIPIGAIRYAFMCREDGNPIDDLLIYHGEEEVYLVVNAGNTDAVLAWMRQHMQGFDVQLEDQTDDFAMLALQGQASQATLQGLLEGLDLADLKYYRFGFGTLCGIPNVRVSRTGYTGEHGYEVYVPSAEAVRVWNKIRGAGEAHGLLPIGLGARDTLRLEAGMALYGHEIDSEHNPIEAGLSFGISFAEEKGDWIGKSALEAVRDNPTRKLIALKTEGPRIPRQGTKLFAGKDEIGEVCSGSRSPTLDTNIATAYVPTSIEEGDAVELDFRGKRQTAVVCSLPFYSRTRK